MTLKSHNTPHHGNYCLCALFLLQELDDNLAELTRQFEEATAAKLKCQQEAETTARTISLANRLVGGLAAEKVRWAESVEKFRKDEKTLGWYGDNGRESEHADPNSVNLALLCQASRRLLGLSV